MAEYNVITPEEFASNKLKANREEVVRILKWIRKNTRPADFEASIWLVLAVSCKRSGRPLDESMKLMKENIEYAIKHYIEDKELVGEGS